MNRHPTEQSFLKDVAAHQMTVVSENGVHRHVRFKKPNTSNMHFDLITWPGYLAYSGDMGCFVFSRLQDMFEFFRDKGEGPLRINLGYWSEKLDAVDKPDGAQQFSEDLFRENIKRWLDEAEADDQLRQEVEEEVLSHVEGGTYGAHEAYKAAQEFESSTGFRFTDFWEVNSTEYTFRFVWCCYALAWGIRQYDAAAASQSAKACEPK